MRLPLRRAPPVVWLMLGVLALIMASLYLLSDMTQSSTRFGRAYIGLLVFNTLLLVVLVALIGANVVGLARQVLNRQPGSRLTLRLTLMFALLALVPAAVVFTFSVRVLDKGIDSWFDVQVQRALEDALELSRSSLDVLMRQLKDQSEPLAARLTEVSDAMAPIVLHRLLHNHGATEMTLFGENSRIIAAAREPNASRMPRLPNASMMGRVNDGESYVGLDPVEGGGLNIRLVIPVPTAPDRSERRYLQMLYSVAPRISRLADSVESGFGKYNELTYLRGPLKQSLKLTLLLVLLLGVLFAVWTAFFLSRRLMAPIRELAHGTEAVAAGQYHERLPVGRKDELGLLVMSFNQMTERLAQARDEADRSQAMLESQRTYLQTVLQSLSSGVVSLDRDLVVRTVNATASDILGLDLEGYVGRPFADWRAAETAPARFYDSVVPVLSAAEEEWQEQVALFSPSGRKTLICRGTRLPAHGALAGGHVIVFDDVTALIQAQRNAAWGEVARRLAHEIKNPLTPIQLSAERLRAKLAPQLAARDAEILERSTDTIVAQVESMKTMVNAFSDYARPPTMKLEPLDLNRLITDVAELYRAGDSRTRLQLDLEDGAPRVEGDAVRLRQILHNLIKNALEAMGSAPEGRLRITTRSVEEGGHRFVDVEVRDHGPGFPSALMDNLFEPYVTDKVKGNGLGLAIVKKIVEEHGGFVWAENLDDGGAGIGIRLLSLDGDTQTDQSVRGDAA